MSEFNQRLNPRNGKRERLTVSSSAVQFVKDPTGQPQNFYFTPTSDQTNFVPRVRVAEGAVLQVIGGDSIYWTIDGSTPSASVGFRSDPEDFIYLASFQQIREFRAIRLNTDTAIEAVAMFPV